MFKFCSSASITIFTICKKKKKKLFWKSENCSFTKNVVKEKRNTLLYNTV